MTHTTVEVNAYPGVTHWKRRGMLRVGQDARVTGDTPEPPRSEVSLG